jgi:hypothetical protein
MAGLPRRGGFTYFAEAGLPRLDGITPHAQVLPAEVSPALLPQLTAGMDSGSKGRAGGFHSMFKLGLNLYVYFDKIHRIIRDMKVSRVNARAVQMQSHSYWGPFYLGK